MATNNWNKAPFCGAAYTVKTKGEWGNRRLWGRSTHGLKEIYDPTTLPSIYKGGGTVDQQNMSASHIISNCIKCLERASKFYKVERRTDIF